MPYVKPAPKPVYRETDIATLVRRAEGPVEHAKRKRYVEYEFGSGRGKGRRFYGNTDGTR